MKQSCCCCYCNEMKNKRGENIVPFVWWSTALSSGVERRKTRRKKKAAGKNKNYVNVCTYCLTSTLSGTYVNHSIYFIRRYKNNKMFVAVSHVTAFNGMHSNVANESDKWNERKKKEKKIIKLEHSMRELEKARPNKKTK